MAYNSTVVPHKFKGKLPFQYGCDEVCIRQRVNSEHFQHIWCSTNVLKTFTSNANSLESPLSKTDFVCYKPNSFSNNNKQFIYGNNTAGHHLSLPTKLGTNVVSVM